MENNRPHSPIRHSFTELQNRQAQSLIISQAPPIVVNSPPSPINLKNSTMNFESSTIQSQPQARSQYIERPSGVQTMEEGERELEFWIHKRKEMGIATPQRIQPRKYTQEIYQPQFQTRISETAPIVYQSVIEQTPQPYVSQQIPVIEVSEEPQKFWDENQQQFQQPQVVDQIEVPLEQLECLSQDQQIPVCCDDDANIMIGQGELIEDEVEIIGSNNDHLHQRIGDLSQSLDQFQQLETTQNNTIFDLQNRHDTMQTDHSNLLCQLKDLQNKRDCECCENEKEKENILKQIKQMKQDRDHHSQEVHDQLENAKNMVQGNYLLTLLQFLGLIFIVLELRYVLTGNVLSPAQQMTPYVQNLYAQFEAKEAELIANFRKEEEVHEEEENDDHEE